MDFSRRRGRRTAPVAAIRTLHRTIQSVGATGGVYNVYSHLIGYIQLNGNKRCTHRPSLLPIEWSGEVFGSRRRGRFAAPDVARSPLNLII